MIGKISGRIDYIAQDPPLYTAPSIVVPPVHASIELAYATLPSDTCVWIFALDNASGIHAGFELLLSPLALLTVPTNAAGVGGFELPIDTSLSGIGIWTQMAFFDTSLKNISPVRGTGIW